MQRLLHVVSTMRADVTTTTTGALSSTSFSGELLPMFSVASTSSNIVSEGKDGTTVAGSSNACAVSGPPSAEQPCHSRSHSTATATAAAAGAAAGSLDSHNGSMSMPATTTASMSSSQKGLGTDSQPDLRLLDTVKYYPMSRNPHGACQSHVDVTSVHDALHVDEQTTGQGPAAGPGPESTSLVPIASHSLAAQEEPKPKQQHQQRQQQPSGIPSPALMTPAAAHWLSSRTVMYGQLEAMFQSIVCPAVYAPDPTAMIQQPPLGYFFSVVAPPMSIASYLQRIMMQFDCSPCTFPVALTYFLRVSRCFDGKMPVVVGTSSPCAVVIAKAMQHIHRFPRRRQRQPHQPMPSSIRGVPPPSTQADTFSLVHPLAAHRLLLACCVLAVKYIDDVFYKSSYYAAVGGIALEELSRLEWYLFQLLDYDLYVDVDCLQGVASMLMALGATE